MYVDKIKFVPESLLETHVWLKGHVANDDPQLTIDFRVIDDTNNYHAIIGFCNLADGVDMDEMKAVMDYCNKHEKALRAFHSKMAANK